MNKQEMIEKLKDETKTLAFGLLSKEEQCVLERAGKDSCQCYYDSGWGRPVSKSWRPCVTYILKPDYQPEPEYRTVEVVVDSMGILCLDRRISALHHENLWWTTSHKDFIEFKSGCTTSPHVDFAVRRKRDGHKVYARFVKE